MDLYINGKKAGDLPAARFPTAAALVEHVLDEEMIDEGQIVAAVEIDGREIDADEQGLEETPIGGDVARVSITTESAYGLLLTAIREAIVACREMVTQAGKAAEQFRGPSVADAGEFYAAFTGRMLETLQDAKELNGFIDGALEGFDTRRLETNLNRLKPHLESALKYQEDADWVMLADVLEYEIAGVFDDIAAYLDEAKTTVESRG
ncbi:hypothetical protein K8I61_06400 [bacterium]|nr:hypothetical protein [bacterium]